MANLNISLPDPLTDYVEERTAEGGYSTVSEYIRALVQQDQQRQADARLETLLLEGLASGDATVMNPEDWDALRDEVRHRASQRGKPQVTS